MRLETKRLILRPWEESDAERLFELARDPAVGPIAGWPVHTSVEFSLEVIRNVFAMEGVFAVCLKEAPFPIGCAGLVPRESGTREKEFDVGYWLGSAYWGKGYIPEAVEALERLAFEELDCASLWCGTYDGNARSLRVQEKCGFRYHHTERDKPCELMGDVRTEHFSRLTAEEWRKWRG